MVDRLDADSDLSLHHSSVERIKEAFGARSERAWSSEAMLRQLADHILIEEDYVAAPRSLWSFRSENLRCHAPSTLAVFFGKHVGSRRCLASAGACGAYATRR